MLIDQFYRAITTDGDNPVGFPGFDPVAQRGFVFSSVLFKLFDVMRGMLKICVDARFPIRFIVSTGHWIDGK
ncbi:MAG: hypothetical protein LH606_15920 [Cytophagaceae bacterium]|nr:hypothetical protein [Cytophagaceae bacterium]